MHPGRGPGLTARRLGERTGAETANVSDAQMASHSHTARGSENAASASAPAGNYVARGASRGVNTYLNADTSIGASKELLSTGGGQAHNNMQPFLTLNFCIAIQGLFPSRN